MTGYEVECVSGDGGQAGAGSGPASPVTVEALTNGSSYVCRVRATNTVGTGAYGPDSGSWLLAVTPAGGSVVSSTPVSASSVSVEFSPGADGGSPVTGYEVECVSGDGGQAGVGSGPASPVTVEALTNGASYVCRVRATNTVGTGAYGPDGSPFVQEVPPVEPAGGSVTSSTPVSASSVSVEFSPGADGGSPVTGYEVECVSGDGGQAGVGSGPASPVTVEALTNGSSYVCRVRATNTVGTGAYGPDGSPFVQAVLAVEPGWWVGGFVDTGVGVVGVGGVQSGGRWGQPGDRL